jgi:tetratricopeptide (TPR) repeat protein
MISFINAQIPPPSNWQDFESLCADLWRAIWNDPDTQKNGRGGQEQNGVDVYGQPQNGDTYEGVQCKGKDGRYGQAVTAAELRAEVEKTKSFSPKITKFILATTAPNDQKIQGIAREITEKHRAEGLFDVVVLGWEEILARLVEHTNVLQIHYSDFVPQSSKILDGIELLSADQLTEATLAEERHAESICLAKEVLDVALLLKRQLNNAEIGSSNPIDEFLNDELDQCREWLKAFKCREAIQQLERLKAKHWQKATNRTRFRIVSNIAAAHLILGDNEKAANGYLEAYQYDANDEISLCNVSLAHLINGDTSESVRFALKAVEKYPESSRGYSSLLAVLSEDPKLTDPTPHIPQVMLKNADVLYALGRFFIKKQQFKKALEYLGRSYATDNSSVEIQAGYAEAILSDILDVKIIARGGGLSKEQREQVEKARDLLTEAWEKVKTTDVVFRFLSHAQNLSTALALLGQNDAALSVAEEVHSIDSTDHKIVRQIALLLIRMERFDRASSILKITPNDAFEEKVLLQAEVLIELAKFDDALVLLSEFLSSSPSPELLFLALRLKNLVTKHLVGLVAAKNELFGLLDENPTNIFFKIQLSDFLYEEGDIEASKTVVKEAYRALSDTTDYAGIYFLAETLFKHSLYKEAASLYEKMIVPGDDSPPMRQLLICLIEDDRRTNALSILEDLPSHLRHIPFYLKISGVLYRRIGDLEAAADEFLAYIEKVPNDLQIFLAWVEVSHSLGKDDKVKKMLAERLDYPNAKPKELVQLFHLLYHFGYEDRAEKLAYKVRRQFPNDPDIHLGYVFLYLNGTTDSKFLDIKTVDLNTAFLVEFPNGQKKWFIIDDDIQCNFDLGELPSDHPISQKALGKKAGQTIITSNSEIYVEESKVIEVKHKYIHALHQSMNDFGMKFPGNQNLQNVPITISGDIEKDLKPILDTIARRHQTMKTIEEIYITSPMPLCIVAHMINEHPFELFVGFAQNKNVSIVCCQGLFEERVSAFDALISPESKIIVDPIALYNFGLFHLLEPLLKVFPDLGIVQSTLDLFDQLIEKRKGLGSEGFMTLNNEGGQIVRTEVSANDVKSNIEILEGLRSWASEHCTMLRAVPKNDPDPEFIQIAEHMHPSFSDSLLAADGSGRLLFSDDLRLRSLGKLHFGINGVWIQPVLYRLLKAGEITLKKYADVIYDLVQAGFVFISTEREVLYALAEDEMWKPTGKFDFMIKTLGDDTSELESSFQVAIGFLVILWEKNIPLFNRRRLFGSILDVFTSKNGVDPIQILDRFAGEFNRISLVDSRRKTYLITIAKWCRGHFYPLPPFFHK